MIERAYFLTSQRLGFGTWTENDDRLAAELWGDPAVTRLTGGPFSPQQVRARLALEIANLRRHHIQYWPLFKLDSGDHIGCCGLRPGDVAAGVMEFGFQLRPAAWGQGHASEAARAVIDLAATRGFSALVAGHHPENHASRRVLERLGFAFTHDALYPPTGRMEPCYRLNFVPRA